MRRTTVVHFPSNADPRVLASFLGSEDAPTRAGAMRALRALGEVALPAVREARDRATGKQKRWIRRFYERITTEKLNEVGSARADSTDPEPVSDKAASEHSDINDPARSG